MNLNYSQTTGHITSDDGTLITTGWSGHGDCKNDPTKEDVVSTGPLPRGLYWVQPWEDLHPGLGPMVAYLKPDMINDMHGRGSFYIHGPAMDKAKYGQESKGCIVIPRPGREAVKFLNPATITVLE